MAIGTTLENRKMKAPPNKFADCKDGNCLCQTGKCGTMSGIVSQQVNEETALKRQRTHWKTFCRNLHVLPSGFGSFLSSLVLFFEQNILMLGRESKIISSVGPYNRRSLSPAERGWTFENIISFEIHRKEKTFAEKSRYI